MYVHVAGGLVTGPGDGQTFPTLRVVERVVGARHSRCVPFTTLHVEIAVLATGREPLGISGYRIFGADFRTPCTTFVVTAMPLLLLPLGET